MNDERPDSIITNGILTDRVTGAVADMLEVMRGGGMELVVVRALDAVLPCVSRRASADGAAALSQSA